MGMVWPCEGPAPSDDNDDVEACVWMPLGPAIMEVLEGGCFL